MFGINNQNIMEAITVSWNNNKDLTLDKDEKRFLFENDAAKSNVQQLFTNLNDNREFYYGIAPNLHNPSKINEQSITQDTDAVSTWLTYSLIYVYGTNNTEIDNFMSEFTKYYKFRMQKHKQEQEQIFKSRTSRAAMKPRSTRSMESSKSKSKSKTRRLYEGARGGLYYIKVRDGKKVKVYVR